MTSRVSWPLLLARICCRKSLATLSPRERLFSFFGVFLEAAWVKSSNKMPLTKASSSARLVKQATAAERFVEELGFCAVLIDSTRPGPSLYVGVCGRRDAHMPRNVQKDPESYLTWTIKDEVMRRGRLFYGKLLGGRSTMIAPRLLPFFNALWGIPEKMVRRLISEDARLILKILRREWEMATRDLRSASGISERARFNKAIDQLQRALKVIPI